MLSNWMNLLVADCSPTIIRFITATNGSSTNQIWKYYSEPQNVLSDVHVMKSRSVMHFVVSAI